jgi:hypothetical protein
MRWYDALWQRQPPGHVKRDPPASPAFRWIEIRHTLRNGEVLWRRGDPINTYLTIDDVEEFKRTELVTISGGMGQKGPQLPDIEAWARRTGRLPRE